MANGLTTADLTRQAGDSGCSLETGLLSLDISARIPRPDGTDEHVRILGGERLEQHREDLGALRAADHPDFGLCGMLRDGREQSVSTESSVLAGASDFHIEVAPAGSPEARQALERILSKEIAEAISATASKPVEPWHSNAQVTLSGPLDGTETFCMSTLHVSRDREWCKLSVHVVVNRTWLVILWNQPADRKDAPVVPSHRVLPGSRVASGQTAVAAWSGQERLARFIQTLLRHHEYTADLIEALFAEWETEFFEAVSELDREVERQALARLQTRLVELRFMLATLDEAQRCLRRRAQNQRGFPGLVRDEAITRSDVLATRISDLRRDLQSGYGLLAGAAAEAAASSSRRQEDRTRRMSIILTVIGAVLLWPGLVAAVYGANVTGLPGQDRDDGLWYLIAGSAGGALLILLFLLGLTLRRRTST